MVLHGGMIIFLAIVGAIALFGGGLAAMANFEDRSRDTNFLWGLAVFLAGFGMMTTAISADRVKTEDEIAIEQSLVKNPNLKYYYSCLDALDDGSTKHEVELASEHQFCVTMMQNKTNTLKGL